MIFSPEKGLFSFGWPCKHKLLSCFWTQQFRTNHVAGIVPKWSIDNNLLAIEQF